LVRSPLTKAPKNGSLVTTLQEEIDHANVHESRARSSSDTGELHRSPNRSPAISTGKRKQSRAHDGDTTSQLSRRLRRRTVSRRFSQQSTRNAAVRF
jgi:hypothetical protein